MLRNHADTQHVDDNGDNVFHVAVKNGSTRSISQSLVLLNPIVMLFVLLQVFENSFKILN